ncbi:MAG: hypothetical protein HY314_00365 [Acidobacteria bacterium]|nr:hypothetical protein [Acidobacteriota bacterium]
MPQPHSRSRPAWSHRSLEIDKIRTWTVPGALGFGDPAYLGDRYESIALYGGKASDSQISPVAEGTMSPDSNTTNNPNIALTTVTYANGASYAHLGALMKIWQVDSDSLKWNVSGGEKYRIQIWAHQATVIIGDCDTGVSDRILDDGRAISDHINECAATARNHGKFVSCVTRFTKDSLRAGMITAQEESAIDRCASQALALRTKSSTLISSQRGLADE